MQRKALTAIQGYFIASIVLMHILFAIYFFWLSPNEEQTSVQPESEVANLPTAQPSPNEPAIPDGPQPPEAGHIDVSQLQLSGDEYVTQMEEDWQASLTLDPTLQSYAEKLLKRAKVPAGAIVVLDLDTAAVLALADRIEAGHPVAPEHQEGQPEHLALRRVAPSASIFKIISAASLLRKGLKADLLYPYKFAKRRITKRHLQPGKGSPQASLASAIAKSNNGFFAATSSRFLNQDDLYQTAADFGFNKPVPFAARVEPSLATVPSDPLERARMSAGFWHSQLTPLHAASIVHTVANKGKFVQPRLVDSVTHSSGVSHKAPSSSLIREAITPEQARIIEQGLRETLTQGTAFQSFRKLREKGGKTRVFGKTGTLGARMPDRTYTWFAGYTRGSNKNLAIAVLAINGERWWRKAPHIAHDLLYFHEKNQQKLARKIK